MKIDKKEALIILILLSLFLLQSLVTLNSTSLTFDDPAIITIGYYDLIYRDTSMHIFHPPLSFLAGGFPLLFMHVNLPYSYQECKDKGIYRCSQDMMFESNNDAEKFGFYARIPFIIISLLLGLLLFSFSKELYGKKAAFLALTLYSFSPAILAYNTIIFTDLMVAFFIFSTIYFLWKFLQAYTKTRLALAGLSLGLALASKFTAILLIPIMLILFGLKAYKSKNRKDVIKKSAKNTLIILLMAFVVLYSTYFFSFDTIADTVPQRNIKHINTFLEKNFPEDSFSGNEVRFLIFDLKVPMPDYWAGLIGQNLIGSTELRKGYLNSEIYIGGKWYYFFEVLLIKTPIPLLMLFFIACFLSIKAIKKKLLGELAVILPMVFFFVIFIPINFNLGLRHILPVVIFMILFSSRVANIQLKSEMHNKLFKIFIILLLLWYVVSAIFIMPDYMAYFNEFVGMENGHKYLLSSNLDQGQDLKRLHEYLKSSDIAKVKLSYHGTFDPSYYKISYELLPMESYIAWGPGYTLYDPPPNYTEDCSKKYGVIAISVSNLHNFHLKNESCFNWLNDYDPIARIGYTIYVYNITG